MNRELIGDLESELSTSLNNGGLCDIKSSVRSPVPREAIRTAGDLRAEVLTKLDRLRATSDSDDAATPDVGETLLNLLPTDAVKREWRLALEERPEVLDEVVDLAEQLLLEALDGRSSDVP